MAPWSRRKYFHSEGYSANEKPSLDQHLSPKEKELFVNLYLQVPEEWSGLTAGPLAYAWGRKDMDTVNDS